MKKALLIGSMMLLAVPAYAQQGQQGGGVVDQVLRGVLGGQSGPVSREDRGGRDSPAYRRTYEDARRDFRNASDRDLADAEERISSQWTKLQAVSQALDDEQRDRRGGGGAMGSSSPRRSGDRDSQGDRGQRDYRR